MGQYAINAAQAAEGQLSDYGIGAAVGITAMIGQNDTLVEVFTLQDASDLTSWAQDTGYVAELSFWWYQGGSKLSFQMPWRLAGNGLLLRELEIRR